VTDPPERVRPVPFAGLPNCWIRTGQPLPLVGTCVLVVALLSGVRLGRLLEDSDARVRRRHRGVRLPGVHGATAMSAALLVLTSGVIAPPAEAHAAYSAPTSNGPNQWSTTRTDRTPAALGSSPLFYWGYGTGTAPDVTDLSGQADTGTSPANSDATPAFCSDGYSPFSASAGCTLTVDADPTVSAPAPSISLQLLNTYAGY
jgi:hypothetical protein